MAKFSRSTIIKRGIKIGPRPVNVTDKLMATLRFLRKYVFKANVVAGKMIPWPMPVKYKRFAINYHRLFKTIIITS